MLYPWVTPPLGTLTVDANSPGAKYAALDGDYDRNDHLLDTLAAVLQELDPVSFQVERERGQRSGWSISFEVHPRPRVSHYWYLVITAQPDRRLLVRADWWCHSGGTAKEASDLMLEVGAEDMASLPATLARFRQEGPELGA
jgi:hypothetical protein